MKNFRRCIQLTFFACLTFFLGSQSGRAQDNYGLSLRSSFLLSQELPIVQPDSLPVSVVRRPRLQPENLGFFERNLWSENGLFRSMGIAAPLTPESRKSELKLRRTMLVAHETSGFVTLGLMLTTVYYGQRVINDGDRISLASAYTRRLCRCNDCHVFSYRIIIASLSSAGHPAQ